MNQILQRMKGQGCEIVDLESLEKYDETGAHNDKRCLHNIPLTLVVSLISIQTIRRERGSSKSS